MPTMLRNFILGWAALAGTTVLGAAQGQELPAAPSEVLRQNQEKQKPTPPPAAAPSSPVNDAQAKPPASAAVDDPASLEAPRNPPPPPPVKTAPPVAKSAGAAGDDGNSSLEESKVPSDSPAETILVPVNEVNLIFTVTDKHGRFIKNLTEKDVQVIDDKKPVEKIRSFRSETDLPLRVGLLVDASNSVRDRFKFEQEAAIEFLNQIVRAKSDKAFVLGFDTTAEVTQDFTSDTEKLSRGVRMLRPGGGTALFDALYYAARDKLMKSSAEGQAVRKAIILVSDGEDNQSRVTREEAVEMAQRAEVIIYAISTNTSGIVLRGDKILQHIADATGGRAFFPFKIQDVADCFSQIQEELRSQYALAYKPADFHADGRYRSIDIVAQNNKKLRVRSRRGYYAPAQ